jgi:general secretion pathway protein H
MLPPRSFTACNFLPPEGAAAPAACQSQFRGPCRVGMPTRSFTACNSNRLTRGFTLLELLVVIAIMALATAGVSLAMRDNAQTTLEREAQRLAVLFESARAQSRTSGVRVVWHTTANGFQFDGLAPGALPSRWLAEGTTVRGANNIQLGPEPIIGPQVVELLSSQSVGQSADQLNRSLLVATDGLRPFAVQAAGQP